MERTLSGAPNSEYYGKKEINFWVNYMKIKVYMWEKWRAEERFSVAENQKIHMNCT